MNSAIGARESVAGTADGDMFIIGSDVDIGDAGAA